MAAANISEFGDWSARLTLAALILAKTDSAAWVGMVAVVFVAPSIGLGQVVTGWVDRFDPKTILVVGDLIRAFLFVILALVELDPVAVLMVVFAAATIDPVFAAKGAAATFDTLDEHNRDDGVRFRQVTILLFQLGGLAAAGVALDWWEPQTLLFMNAASFALSAFIIAGTRVPRPDTGPSPTLRETLAAALGVTVRQPDIRAALLTTTITIFAATAVEAQVVVLAQDQPRWVLPLASAVVPLTAAAAIALASTEGGTRQVLRRTLISTSVFAATAIAALATGQPWAVVVAFGCIGAMFQTTGVGQVIAVRHLPTKGRAPTLSFLQTVVLVGSASGAAAGGFAIQSLGQAQGLSLCLGVVALAWLVPLPSSTQTLPS